jgi:hypothetical protein
MTNSSDKYADSVCKMRKTNGDPCESRALKGGDFCHYHKVMGATPVIFDNQAIHSTHVYLPRLESASSIQAAISEVCELMLHRRIEPKEASALFYAMQVASQNVEPQALPPGTIQASAVQPPRRRPGRPRKTVPQLPGLPTERAAN